tara:strand:- start:83 stop:583 length:501 start_codon:yes stop_codon:yes gene_type:complete
MITVSQSFLFGPKVKTHILMMSLQELGGGAFCLLSAPEVMSLEDIKKQAETEAFFADIIAKWAQFWKICPSDRKDDRIACVYWMILPSKGSNKIPKMKIQFLGSGRGKENPLNFPLEDHMLKQMLAKINADEVKLAKSKGFSGVALKEDEIVQEITDSYNSGNATK